MTQPSFPIVPPAGLRFRRRHVQESIATYIEQNLIARGWGKRPSNTAPVPDDTVNFGGSPLAYIRQLPEELQQDITYNTIATTLGDEPENMLEQLGGALWSTTFPVIVDIYGESASGSVSIAGDVKAILAAQAIPIFDFSVSPPVQVDGEYVEFEQVRGPLHPSQTQGVSQDFRRHWRQITADAVAYFSISEMD